MRPRLLVGVVISAHLAAVLFIGIGGFAVLWQPALAWVQVPMATWGVLVNLANWTCPLTPLENSLRAQADMAGYEEGFVEHYSYLFLNPPSGDASSELRQWSGRSPHLAAGFLILILNCAAYAVVFIQHNA